MSHFLKHVAFYFAFILLLCVTAQAQIQIPSRPNRYNDSGQRVGKWVILYDSLYENEVPEASGAHYYCLTELKDGKPMGTVECFYMTGVRQYEGYILSFDPQIKHGKATFYHANGNIKEKVIYENDTVQGAYVSYHPNGLLESSGEVLDGNRQGPWEYYHDNGQLQAAVDYKNGLESGYSEIFYPTGQLNMKGNFIDGKHEGPWEFHYPSGQLSYSGNFSQGMYHGKWHFYFEDGNLKSVGTYTNDIKDGEFIFYYENGQIESKGLVVEGLYQGDWSYYYADGRLKSKGPYKDDLEHGYWKYYKENGALDSECNLTMGEWDGIAKFYHDNGKIRSTGLYRNDLKQGRWKYFNDQEALIGISHYVDEVEHGPYENYTVDGVLRQKGNMLHGKKDGEWFFYYPNGQLEETGFFKNDLANGSYTFYYEHGVLKKAGEFLNGKSEGYWKFYFENGKLKTEGSYKNDLREGLWKYYHETGGLSAVGNYEKGESTGEWKYYYENGTLSKHGNEQNDKSLGHWTYYDEQGGWKDTEGYWVNGQKHGPWKFYDSLGNITQTDQYHNDKAINFSTLYDSTTSLSSQRKYEEAMQMAAVTEEYFDERFSKSDLLYADVHGLYGDVYYDMKDYRKAKKYYQKSLKHILSHKSDTSSWYTNYLQRIAQCYYRMENYNESVDTYRRILDLVAQRPGGVSSSDYTDKISLMTDALNAAGRSGEALQTLREQQEIQLQFPDQKETIVSNYLSLVRYAYEIDSISYMQRVADTLISYCEANELQNHWTYPSALYYKGRILEDLYMDSSEVYYQNAVNYYFQTGDTTFYQFFDGILRLGSHYYGLNLYDKSRPFYFEGLRRLEEVGEIDNQTYRKAVLGVAKQYWAEGKYNEALDYYQQALKLEEGVPSPNLHIVSQAHLGVAICLEALGPQQYAKSESSFVAAISSLEDEKTFSAHYVNAKILYSGFLRNSLLNIEKANDILYEVLRYIKLHQSPDLDLLVRTHKELGENYYKLQKIDSALIYFQRTADLAQKDLASNVQAYTEAHRYIGDIYEDLEDYQKAQSHNFLALNTIDEYLGKENAFYANSLGEIGRNFLLQENDQTAVKYYTEALALKEKLYARDHDAYLSAMVSLAEALMENDQVEESLKMLLSAKDRFESKKARLNSWYLTCLERLTEAYEADRQIDKAEETILEKLKLAGRLYGTGNVKYADHLRDVGAFYSRQQMYDVAINYTRPGFEMIKDAFGRSIKYAWAAESLSWIEFNLENFTRAIELKEEAAAIYLEMTGESGEYVDALYGLSEIYRSLGQYQNAVDALEEASRVAEKLYGSFSFATANVLTELGSTYWRWKQPEKSIIIYQQIEALYDSLGPYSHYYASLYNRMGLAQFDLGAFEEAKNYYEKAIAIADQFEEDNGTGILYRNNLAFYYLQREDFEMAEKLWLEAEKELNSEDENDLIKVRWLDNMAALYLAWGKMDKAEYYWTETTNILLQRLTRDFPYLSESGKAAFWDAYKENFEYFNSYAIVAQASGNQVAVSQMYDNQLRTKSILLSTSSKERRKILNSGDSTLISTYLGYVDLKEKLAKYYGYTKEKLQTENIDIQSLEKESTRYEKVLSLDANALRNEEKSATVSWKSIQKSLKEGEAAVEIIRFRHFDKVVSDSVLYAALILTSQTKDHPRLVILPNGRELETKYVRAYRSFIQYQMDDVTSYPQFWEAIDEELQNISTVYLSPDGVYNQINVGTLLRPDGSFIGDSYTIRLLTSTRDIALAKATASRTGEKTGYLFGFPKYDLAHAEIEDDLFERGIQNRTINERATDLSRFGFTELPGTKTETESIAGLLLAKHWKTSLYLAEGAIEEELKQVSSPTVLHIATHGFFLDNPEEKASGMQLGVRTEVSKTNPLLRSGLLLAGAAQTARGAHDGDVENGIFTAYEAMNLNLNGTELVVLSACETGRGEIKNGEGVYGLQRAFQIAGAEAIIMSLWKVNDAATQLLMTEFYEAWIGGNTKSQALSIAQAKVREQYPHPYYWGAFVLVGGKDI